MSTFFEREIPKEIDGCSGYFYKTLNDRKQGKYIAINDLGMFGFLKIGNKMEKFIQLQNQPKSSKPLFLYENVSKTIKLRIQVKTQKQVGDEDTFVTGVITIQTSDGKKIIIPFVGNIAC